MEARCLTCPYAIQVRNTRGARVTDHPCPHCGTPLVGAATGKARGRYLCPIGGYVVTLGRTATQLTEASRVVWVPGWAPAPYRIGTYRSYATGATRQPPQIHVATPGDAPTGFGLLTHKIQYLNQAEGKVFGPGCVVGDALDNHTGLAETGQAGVCLQPAPDTDPTTWIVNQPLTYRRCAACATPTPVLPDTLTTTTWTPGRAGVWRGQGRYNRRLEPVNTGPHPAGTIRCRDCDPQHTRPM